MSESQTKKYESLAPGIRAFLLEGESLYPENAVEFAMDEQRAFYDRCCAHFRKSRPEAVSAEDFTVGSIPCRLYSKAGTSSAPVHLYLHGGGYVVGGLDSHDDVCAEICNGAAIDIIAVQYRLEQRASEWNHLRSGSCSRFKAIEQLMDGQLTVRCSSASFDAITAACASLAHRGLLP